MRTYFLLIGFSLVACGTTEEIVTTEEVVEEQETNDIVEDKPTLKPMQGNELVKTTPFSIGEVHVSEEEGACPLYIETRDKTGSKTLYPIDLDDAFKVEGLILKFSYTIHNGDQPDACSVDHVVRMKDVSKMNPSENLEEKKEP